MRWRWRGLNLQAELVGSRLQREAAPSVLFSRREANFGPEARTAVLAFPAGGCRRDRHSHCGWLLGATKRGFRDCKVPAATIARHAHGERRSAPDATSRAARFFSRFGWGGDKNSAWGAARSGGKRTPTTPATARKCGRQPSRPRTIAFSIRAATMARSSCGTCGRRRLVQRWWQRRRRDSAPRARAMSTAAASAASNVTRTRRTCPCGVV